MNGTTLHRYDLRVIERRLGIFSVTKHRQVSVFFDRQELGGVIHELTRDFPGCIVKVTRLSTEVMDSITSPYLWCHKCLGKDVYKTDVPGEGRVRCHCKCGNYWLQTMSTPPTYEQSMDHDGPVWGDGGDSIQ